MPTPEKIAEAILSDVQLTEPESRAVIQIAAAAITVDRAVHREEIGILQHVAVKLGHNAEPEFKALFAKLGPDADEPAAERRLREAAARVESAAAREVAYKIAYAITLADLVATDRESAFHRKLIEVLCLSTDDAARLADDVTAVMKAE
jgi:hypothetical protein